jgi:gamma-glutamylputrescine oxidase
MRGQTHPASLWRETATPASPAQPLDSAIEADIAIIGGGYTGLSAALRALELNLKPAIIEASEVGWGASGRNGGVVSTKFRVSLSDIAKHRGLGVAKQMNRLGHDAMDCVESYVETFSLSDAAFGKTGNLHCAHNEVALGRLIANAKVQREMFDDTSLTVLDASETAAETGSSNFMGGVLSSHAGVIHPLNYARGLAAAVRALGGQIFEQSPVLAKETVGGHVHLSTSGGSVKARKLIIASNGYSDLTDATRAVQRTVIPFRSAIIATEPLPIDIFTTLMPNGRSYSETRRMMRWFRRAGDRMLFGGRGAFGKTDSGVAFRTLEGAMKQLFPQLANKAITHRWSGLVAMTMDSLPQIGMLDERTAFSLGYNGAGIAMASLLGRHVVDLLIGRTPDLAIMRRERPSTIPFYFFRQPAVRIVAGWYQFLDSIGR